MISIHKPPISKVLRYSAVIKKKYLFLLCVLCASAGDIGNNCSVLHAQENDFSEVPIWRHALGGAVIGHPVSQVESVVAITDGGNLKSFSSQGTPLWDYYARGRLTPFVSRSREGTSYICRTNGLLIAVNRSGRELWTMNLGSPIVSPVLCGWDGRLFVFTENKITCTTAAGYTLWTRALEEKIALAPIIDAAGGIVFVQENGELLSIDSFGNAYSYEANKLPAAAASIELENMGPTAVLLHGDNSIELVYTNLKFGVSVQERLNLPSPPFAAAGRNEKAAVLLRDGRIALVSPAYREIHWTGASHLRAGEINAATKADDVKLLFDERGIYVITKSGASGFAADGRRLWTMRLTGAASVPSFGDDGILYSGGGDWILYAYRLESRIRSKQRLLYGEKSEGDYGTGRPGPSSMAGYYFRFEEAELEARFAEIRTAIREGNVGNNEKEYAAWLMETASSSAGAQYRIEAIRLLAYIGSRETIPFLANLFIRDRESLVKAAAAEAIGKIGVDPEGLALRAFENALLPPFRILDETALTAVAAATGALSRFSGPTLSEAGVRILTILLRYDNFPVARSQAQRELAGFRRFQ